MKRYIRAATEEEASLLAIKEISSVVYVEDPNELEWYDTSSLMPTECVQAAKSTVPDYSTWTRDQLLQLKEQDFIKFDRIRNDKVLFQILKYEDLTPNQLLYVNGRKTVSRDVKLKEITHILKLLKICDDFYRVPSSKNKEFIDYLKKYDISLKQSDIKNIMHNLHIQDFSEGRYSNDGNYWGYALIIFEFRDPTFKFSCGKSLPDTELPLKIYIKIDENLSTKESVAIISFHSPEYKVERPTENGASFNITYTKVVVILADTPVEGYDNAYYIPECKMYLNLCDVVVNSLTGVVVGKNKLHDSLISEISGNAHISIARCAQATFENGKMRSDAVNWEILSKEQLAYIDRLNDPPEMVYRSTQRSDII